MSPIRVHSPNHVRAALAAARDLGRTATLLSPQAGLAGIGWWRALMAQAAAEFPEVSFTGVLDCGPSIGLAMAAIRTGAGPVQVAADAAVLERLADIARQAGTWVDGDAAPGLDLLGTPDPGLACRDWLATN